MAPELLDPMPPDRPHQRLRQRRIELSPPRLAPRQIGGMNELLAGLRLPADLVDQVDQRGDGGSAGRRVTGHYRSMVAPLVANADRPPDPGRCPGLRKPGPSALPPSQDLFLQS